MIKFTRLSKRIKTNEGYSNIIYKDQLGHPTIGYGHLIKTSNFFNPQKKYSKQLLLQIFNADLNKAITDFKKYYPNKKQPENIQEVIIEMIFQLGIKGVLKFNKFNLNIKKKHYHLAALEMIKSKLYMQTPKRVDKLISILLTFNAK